MGFGALLKATWPQVLLFLLRLADIGFMEYLRGDK